MVSVIIEALKVSKIVPNNIELNNSLILSRVSRSIYASGFFMRFSGDRHRTPVVVGGYGISPDQPLITGLKPSNKYGDCFLALKETEPLKLPRNG